MAATPSPAFPAQSSLSGTPRINLPFSGATGGHCCKEAKLLMGGMLSRGEGRGLPCRREEAPCVWAQRSMLAAPADLSRPPPMALALPASPALTSACQF